MYDICVTPKFFRDIFVTPQPFRLPAQRFLARILQQRTFFAARFLHHANISRKNCWHDSCSAQELRWHGTCPEKISRQNGKAQRLRAKMTRGRGLQGACQGIKRWGEGPTFSVSPHHGKVGKTTTLADRGRAGCPTETGPGACAYKLCLQKRLWENLYQ